VSDIKSSRSAVMSRVPA